MILSNDLNSSKRLTYENLTDTIIMDEKSCKKFDVIINMIV